MNNDEIAKYLYDNKNDYSDIDTINCVREELKQSARNWMINWSKQFSYAYQMAVFSAVTGRWDDIEKDLRRNKYTLEEAILILDFMLKFNLINKDIYDYKIGKWSNL